MNQTTRGLHDSPVTTGWNRAAHLSWVGALLGLLAMNGVSGEPGKGANLLYNGGFEEAIAVDFGKYLPPLANHVQVPTGKDAMMPAGVFLNPNDGWNAGTQRSFEYVSGTEGDAVHGGKRAIHVVSPEGFSTLIVGGSKWSPQNFNIMSRIHVTAEASLDEDSIVLNRPYAFRLAVKGKGEVCVGLYCYDLKGNGILKAGSLEVTPGNFAITQEGWMDCAGAITIRNPEVKDVLFLVRTRGDLTFDDVVLSGN